MIKEKKFFTILSRTDLLLFFLIFPIISFIILFKKNSLEMSEKFKINKKNLITSILLFLIASFSLINNYGTENTFIYFEF